MRTISLKILTFLLFTNFVYAQTPEQKIVVFGDDIKLKFIQYVVDLTDNPNPKICYLPTASADNKENIEYWEFICEKIDIEPYVLKVWLDSEYAVKSFEEIIMGMDAIVVGGGNTLNMLGIWKSQGIDTLLNQALKKGIILAGGSAGSICWFQSGVSDSRPVSLSIVEGLGFLPFSNCPHYSNAARKNLFHQKMKDKVIGAGYASDDLSGILFVNGEYRESVSLNDLNDSYFVSLKNGEIVSKKLNSRILIGKDAIGENDYSIITINKKVKDFPPVLDQTTPLNAFLSVQYLFASGTDFKYKDLASYHIKPYLKDTLQVIKKVDEEKRNRILNIDIHEVFVYNDSIAGVVNKMYSYYGLWYFYKENGKWVSAGEDIGGNSLLQAEIIFREKAKMHMQKLKNVPQN